MIPFPDKKYKTIVIDPPWKIETGFNIKTQHSPMTRVPYQTMTMKEIESLPLNDLMDKNCSVFLWTIQLYLKQSFDLIKEWDLRFHCLLTWDKMEGINVWGFTRNSEFVIYCYKGHPNLDLTKKFMPTCFREKRRKHSQKPDVFYNHLLRLTLGPRLDMFSRTIRHGYDTWGNDPNLIESQPLEVFG